MAVTSVAHRPDILRMGDAPQDENERAAAFEWLVGDLDHRAIVAPTELAAVLDMYAARTAHPDATFTRDQFLVTGQTFPSGLETRYVGYRNYFTV